MGINRTRKPLKLNSAGISYTRALYVASAVRTEVITAEDSLSVTKETTYKDALALKTKEIRAKDSRDSIDGDKSLNSRRQRLSLRYFPHTWEFQVY